MLFHSLYRKTGEAVCLAYLPPQFSVERAEKKLSEEEGSVSVIICSSCRWFVESNRSYYTYIYCRLFILSLVFVLFLLQHLELLEISNS
jgi:hypothetical protein